MRRDSGAGGDAAQGRVSLRGRGWAREAAFRTSFSGCAAFPARLVAVLPLLLFLFFSCALAQDLAFTTRLSPWPPEGWPEGAQGEVRLGAVTPEPRLVTFLSFPVSETGEVTYRLPETLPEGAEALYMPAYVDLFVYCSGVNPVVSPPEAELVYLNFFLFADGEPWGSLDVGSTVETSASLRLRVFWGLLYAKEPFAVAGSGQCESGVGAQVETELAFKAGLNLVELGAVTTLEETNVTLRTVPLLDLPQTPVSAGF